MNMNINLCQYVNICATLLVTMLQDVIYKQATNKHLDNKYLSVVVTILISIKTFCLFTACQRFKMPPP